MEEEEIAEEGEEDEEITEKGREAHLSHKVLGSDGGMPFEKPDREMRKRIEKRLQLTPSALLEKNRDEFFSKFNKMRAEKEEIVEESEEETEEEKKEER